ncbi:MAG: glycoside hydrolase family 20 zincin-like fold domain-containing protein, partial [Planctomycetota bacterium]
MQKIRTIPNNAILITFIIGLTAGLNFKLQAIEITAKSFSKINIQKRESIKNNEVIITPTDNPPVIDGKLEDPAWDKAAVIKGFFKAGTVKLTAGEKQTLSWICYNDKNIYFAFACLDQNIKSGKFNRDSKSIWQNDCIEIFLSPERDPKQERQFIANVSGSKWDSFRASGMGRFGELWNPKPDWEFVTQIHEWGYISEIRIPIASLLSRKYRVGRGTVWNMKLTRQDFGSKEGHVSSSWTIIGTSTHDRFAAGKLVFQNRNLFIDGGFEEKEKTASLWRKKGKGCKVLIEKTSDDKKSDMQSVKISVKPAVKKGAWFTVWPTPARAQPQPVDCTYFFTADIKIVPDNKNRSFYGRFRLKDNNKYQTYEIKEKGKWQTVMLAQTVKAGRVPTPPDIHGNAAGGGIIYIDNIKMVIGEADMLGNLSNSWCLTGNARNQRRTRNKIIPGSYTYNEAKTTSAAFPKHSMHAKADEPGRYAGWIPFSKGKLTDKLTATSIGWPGLWNGNNGYDINFDLGKDYSLDQVELISSRAAIIGASIYLKSEDEKLFTMTDTTCDLIKFNKEGFGTKKDQVIFKNIKQKARWIRLQLISSHTYTAVAEVLIWGKDKAEVTKLKRIPYQHAKGKVQIKKPTSKPVTYKNIPVVFPQAKEIKQNRTIISLPENPVISYQPVDSERAKITAEVLRDELKLSFGITATIQKDDPEVPHITIIEDSSDIPSKIKAEGYMLTADSKGIAIKGRDKRGAFYGCMTLLTIARKISGKLTLPETTINDWPDLPLRMVQGRPRPSENLVRALARFRIKYYTPHTRFIRQAAAIDKFAKRYFVAMVPHLDPRDILKKHPELTEHAPDEKLKDLGVGRRNPNYAHPGLWELYFKEVDKWLPQFHGDLVSINFDEMYQYPNGSRWNVSKESRAMKMTAPQLLSWTINKIDKYFKKYNKRISMYDTCFMPGHRLSYPGDPDPQWRKAAETMPRDMVISVWHPKTASPYLHSLGHTLVYMPLDDKDWREKVGDTDFPGPYYKGIDYYMMDGVFKVSNLLAEANICWNTKALRAHDKQADNIIDRYVPLWNELNDGSKLPSRSASTEDYITINIAESANRSRIDEIPFDGKGWVDLGANMDLRSLPSGKITCAEIPFNIINESENNGKSVIAVQNRSYIDKTLPTETEIKTDNLKAASLIFLHCLDNRPGINYMRRRELAGFYFMVYDDNTYAKHEIKYAVSTANWDGLPTNWGYSPKGHTMKKGFLAWQGKTTSGMNTFLYATEWVNPDPDKKIVKIIFRAAEAPSCMNPMLLAVTAVNPDLGNKLSDASSSLQPLELLEKAVSIGSPYNLSGGKDISENKYIA